MKRYLLPLLVLMGCEDTTPVSGLLPSYRDAEVTIASKADFDAGRFAGRWVEVASYPLPFQSGCAGATAAYTLTEAQDITVLNTCLDATGAPLRTIEGRAEISGPGRLSVRLDGVPFAAPLWVLWTDADYRVAVLGQPDGRGGWILARETPLRPDLLRAAREVLDFNGYDLTQLRIAPY